METLPSSLWPTPERGGLLSAFDTLFLLSYLAGLGVLLWVSWHRLFREPYSLADDQTDKVLRLMPPGDLRGTLTVLRAYLIYCLLVGGLYSIIALAGSFLWDIAVQVRIPELAGLSLPELPFEMEEPAWPLAVSLAFVGVFDRIPKLQAIERTFRGWAYRSIGIPPFIRRRTSVVVATDLLSRPGAAELNERDETNQRMHDLAEPLLGEARAAELRLDLDRLAVLQRLIYSRANPYPSIGLRTRFEPMLREIRHDVRTLFDEVEGVALLLGGRTEHEDHEAFERERSERRRLLDVLAEKTSRVHWDMCTLIAVLVENEPTPGPETSETLRAFVDGIHERTRSDVQKTDRVLTIAFGCIAVAFLAAWFAISQGLHTPWSRNSPFISALIDTLLVSLIVLPSLLAGLAIQDGREAQRRWTHYVPFSGKPFPISQYVSVFASGFLVAVPLVVLFYAVFFFATANSDGGAARRFMSIGHLYPLLAAIGGIQAVFAAYTVRDVDARARRSVIGAALVHAVVVVLAMTALYQVMANLNPRIGSGLAHARDNWFDIARMALVCAVATYLTGHSEAMQEEPGGRAPSDGRVGSAAS